MANEDFAGFDSWEQYKEALIAIKEEQGYIESISFLLDRGHQVDMDGTITIFKCSELAGDADGKYCVHDSEHEEIFDDIQQAIHNYLELCRNYK